MQEAEASAAQEPTSKDDDDVDIKPRDYDHDPENEAQDTEMSEKTKNDGPPRFSTLFADPLPPRSYDVPLPLKKKRGITIPTPLFIVLAITLFLETTLLFAYTVIGLYNKLPPQLGAFNTPGFAAGIASSCDCSKQPSIQIAPNFYLPSGQGGLGSTLPIHGSPLDGPVPVLPGVASRISSITAFPSAFPTDSPLADKAMESDLLSLLEQQLKTSVTSTGTSTTTSSSSTSTPSSSTTTTTKPTSPTTDPTVTSLKVVTAPPMVTETSMKTVPPSTVTENTTVGQRTPDTSSTETSTPPISSGTTRTAKPTSTATSTTNDATTTTSTNSSSKGTYAPCFGGSGGAQLYCPSGVGTKRKRSRSGLLKW